jgi:hypothetical protein
LKLRHELSFLLGGWLFFGVGWGEGEGLLLEIGYDEDRDVNLSGFCEGHVMNFMWIL